MKNKGKGGAAEGGGGAADVGPTKDTDADEKPVSDSEFTYMPLSLPQASDHGGEAVVLRAVVENDGSFLERAKALLDQKANSKAPAGKSHGLLQP